MRISDWSSDVCSSDLAVNCIARTPLSCLWGTNTDIAGVAWALRDAKLDGAIICLIGSGGAARSVLCRLYNEPIAALRILARDVRKAERLVQGFSAPVEDRKSTRLNSSH